MRGSTTVPGIQGTRHSLLGVALKEGELRTLNLLTDRGATDSIPRAAFRA